MTNDSERRKVFDAIAASLATLDGEPTPLPDYDESFCVSERRLQAGTLWENFAANFIAVNGRTLRSTADLAAYLKENGHLRGFCDPALERDVGSILAREGIEVLYTFDRSRIDDYAFGITRASGAIAESGSLVLNDDDTVHRLAALAPWVHVAVLREPDIVRSIPDGIARLGPCSHVVWVTGPSKTGDIEGILIEGVHGPGVQICLCLG